MFGYVKPVHAELLVREHGFYRALYCGICRAMQRHTGRLSALTLSYDSVFYALVRGILLDAHFTAGSFRCAACPAKCREAVEEHPVLVDTARVFTLLAYGKAEDAYRDRRGGSRFFLLLAVRILRRAAKRAALPALWEEMEKELAALDALEAAHCPSVDEVVDCSGRMLSAFFCEGLSEEEACLAGAVGYHLGRFIAALDAADDFAEDVAQDQYNPYRYSGSGRFAEEERTLAVSALRAELASLEEAVLRLPLSRSEDAADILKNILYLGLGGYVDRLARGEPLHEAKGRGKRGARV